jgi:hypothetical protein
MSSPRPRIFPMKTAGTQHLIERTYREGAAFQWVRETYMNAVEAGATRIEFGIEWQAVENRGVYRRMIADNGAGMTDTELEEFFNTFGGGGKPIGGAHENFGVGAKTALLPWNRDGIVVISWVEGEPSMIWVQQDPITGEYGLRVEDIDDPETGATSLEVVYDPYLDAQHGCDWAAIKPDWIDDHGTVIVLLGNAASDDTVLGDPTRPESDIKGISTYLNRRIWRTNDVVLTVDELRTQTRGEWPLSEREAHVTAPSSAPDRRTNRRTIQGAEHFITYSMPMSAAGRLAASGTLMLPDTTSIDWYLWEGPRPAVQSYAAITGYVGVLYKNELYDVTQHHSTYRSFGVSEGTVRSRLTLIVRPPMLDDDGKHGVYPRTDRNALLLKGGPNAGGSLPLSDWGNRFADYMPDEILNAIKSARIGDEGTVDDATWRKRLAERFGDRWRIPKVRRREGGAVMLTTEQAGTSGTTRKTKKRKKRRGGDTGEGGTAGSRVLGAEGGPVEGERATVAGGIPTYRKVGADSVSPGMLAAWQPHDPEHPEGVVLLNTQHPVLRAEVEHWQAQYPEHYADQIAREVENIYGEIAVAKVAHSEHLKGIITAKVVDEELRSDAALTMALLGLIGEEAVIAPRIGGKFSKRKAA